MRRVLLVLVAVAALAIPAQLHADGPDFSAFAGPWYHHTTSLTVSADGTLTLYDEVSGRPGGPIALYAHLSSAAGNTAYGYNDDGAAVWLTLLPYDMVLYSDPLAQTASVFCAISVSGAPLDVPGMLPSPCGT